MPRVHLLQFRKGTATEWAAINPVLADGEPGVERDTGKLKIGDGVKTWTALPYSSAQSATQTLNDLTDVDTLTIAPADDNVLMYDAVALQWKPAALPVPATPTGETGWTNAVFQNGWLDYGSGYNPGGYIKDIDNYVHLRGMVRSGTQNAAIFTLPVGYRPSYRQLLKGTSADVHCRVDVLTTGEILWITGGNNGWVSLDGMILRAEA